MKLRCCRFYISTVVNDPFNLNLVRGVKLPAFRLVVARPAWLAFPHILKTARMTSTHALTSPTLRALKLFSSPRWYEHNLLQTVEWSTKKLVGQGLQVYVLATFPVVLIEVIDVRIFFITFVVFSYNTFFYFEFPAIPISCK